MERWHILEGYLPKEGGRSYLLGNLGGRERNYSMLEPNYPSAKPIFSSCNAKAGVMVKFVS